LALVSQVIQHTQGRSIDGSPADQYQRLRVHLVLCRRASNKASSTSNKALSTSNRSAPLRHISEQVSRFALSTILSTVQWLLFVTGRQQCQGIQVDNASTFEVTNASSFDVVRTRAFRIGINTASGFDVDSTSASRPTHCAIAEGA